MIYILLIACLALIGFNTYLQLKKRQQPPKETEPEQPALVPAATVIKQLLQQFNQVLVVWQQVLHLQQLLQWE